MKVPIPWTHLLKESAFVSESSFINSSVHRKTFLEDSFKYLIQKFNGFTKFSWLLIIAFLLTFNINAQNILKQNSGLINNVEKNDVKSNLKYIESASIIVSQVLVQHAGDKNWVEHKLLYPREIQLIPASNDFANLLVELDCELPLPIIEEDKNCIMTLPVGEYDEVRVVIEGGNVILTQDAKVSDGNIFNTTLGNLKFPSGAQRGVDVEVNPSIVVVTKLSEELNLDLDLAKSFVFNGSPDKGNGVKGIVFRPVSIPAMNISTHGRISLKVTGAPNSYTCEAAMPISGAWVSVLDQSGNFLSTVLTDEHGEATLILLRGTYDILVEANNQEEVTLQDKIVYIANEIDLGNISMERPVSSLEFDIDNAIFLSYMASMAYAKPGNGNNWDGVLENKTPYVNKNLPVPAGSNEFYYEEVNLDPDDLKCWKFFSFIEDKDTGAQLYIAYNINNQDVVVSFRGTSPENDDFRLVESGIGGWPDFITDVKRRKVAWYLRPQYLRQGEESEISRAVHNGISTAYDAVKIELQKELDKVVSMYSINTVNSRVYFTGHSLGGSMATVASLDLADYLVFAKGYSLNNIKMYSFGAARSITQKLIDIQRGRVPNSYAVAGREDPAPHYLGIIAGVINPYQHIHNMIVLSTNIPDRGESDYEFSGAYKTIGNSRIERSNGNYFDGCVIPGWSVGLLTNYGFKGHDTYQYIKRLENIDSGGIPFISIKNIDFLPRVIGGDRLQLRWQGGVQGPCDRVALLKVDRGEIPNESDIVGIQFGNVVKGDFYPDTEENGYFLTNRNPFNILGNDDGSDYWVGYVDGFGRIIKKVKWNRASNSSTTSSADNNQTLGIDDEEVATNFTIYPTLVNDIIYIETGEISTLKSYQIYNMLGVKMAQDQLSNNRISVRKLPTGNYILKFETEKGGISKRFIKR